MIALYFQKVPHASITKRMYGGISALQDRIHIVRNETRHRDCVKHTSKRGVLYYRLTSRKTGGFHVNQTRPECKDWSEEPPESIAGAYQVVDACITPSCVTMAMAGLKNATFFPGTNLLISSSKTQVPTKMHIPRSQDTWAM